MTPICTQEGVLMARNKKAILRAVKQAKNSEFKATAIKVELEANLDRHWSTDECHDYIMDKLSAYGLATTGEGGMELAHDDSWTDWTPVAPLTYAEFYNDGSVDSEFTFTLLIDNPENVFLIPKIINAFKELANAMDRTPDVAGAGMHTAFLREPNGYYPDNYITDDMYERFNNYKRSMGMLMPAMYFLASSNERSRGLEYRRPGVGNNSHRHAIDWRQGALEFRLFDTCYDNPDAILDNIVVMSKTLKYWTKKYTPTGVEKIAESVKFGLDGSDKLERFYVSYRHIDLLNWGLNKLKPSYYTIGELKKQRKFNVSKRALTKKRKDVEISAQAEYKEYEDRFEYRMKYIERDLTYAVARDLEYERRSGNIILNDSSTFASEVKKRVLAHIDRQKASRLSLKQYLKQKLDAFDNGEGNYSFTA